MVNNFFRGFGTPNIDPPGIFRLFEAASKVAQARGIFNFRWVEKPCGDFGVIGGISAKFQSIVLQAKPPKWEWVSWEIELQKKF